jgi:hypothetical protein
MGRGRTLLTAGKVLIMSFVLLSCNDYMADQCFLNRDFPNLHNIFDSRSSMSTAVLQIGGKVP